MTQLKALLYSKETADELLRQLSSASLDHTNPSEMAFHAFFAHLFKEDFRQANMAFTIFKPSDLLTRPSLAVAGILVLLLLTKDASSQWEMSRLLCEATVYSTELHMREPDCKEFELLHDAVIAFSTCAKSSFRGKLDALTTLYARELAPILPALTEYVADREKKSTNALYMTQAQIEEPFTRKLAELATLDAHHGRLV